MALWGNYALSRLVWPITGQNWAKNYIIYHHAKGIWVSHSQTLTLFGHWISLLEASQGLMRILCFHLVAKSGINSVHVDACISQQWHAIASLPFWVLRRQFVVGFKMLYCAKYIPCKWTMHRNSSIKHLPLVTIPPLYLFLFCLPVWKKYLPLMSMENLKIFGYGNHSQLMRIVSENKNQLTILFHG